MSEYTEKAVRLFKEGYNCSQSVFTAFCDKFGMDEKTALRVSAGLGGGVGRMREVCGAVCGAAMVAGMKYGAIDGADRDSKSLTYKKVQEIAAIFKETNPSIICHELLGLSSDAEKKPSAEQRTEEYYKKRPCVRIVEDAAAATEKVLFPENIKSESEKKYGLSK